MSVERLTQHLTAVPLSDITCPVSGRIAYVDHWFLSKDGTVYKAKYSGAFQCNRNRKIVDVVYGKLISEFGFSSIKIPVAYLEPRQ